MTYKQNSKLKVCETRFKVVLKETHGLVFSLPEESVLHGNLSHCMSDITMNKSGRAMESRITIKTSKVGIR